MSDAGKTESPLTLLNAAANLSLPLVAAQVAADETVYFILYCRRGDEIAYPDADALFAKAAAAYKKIAGRVTLQTPDDFINGWCSTGNGIRCHLGRAILYARRRCMAYAFACMAWRLLCRSAQLARQGRMHFSSYALSQVTKIPEGPLVFDTALHIARQREKWVRPCSATAISAVIRMGIFVRIITI